MAQLEYKIVPAPRRGEKLRGVKSAEDRFALAMTRVLNAQAAEGWTYLRTDTLPSEEREGLLGKTTVFLNMMVFCRSAEAPVQTEDHPAPPRIPDLRDTVTPPAPPPAPVSDLSPAPISEVAHTAMPAPTTPDVSDTLRP